MSSPEPTAEKVREHVVEYIIEQHLAGRNRRAVLLSSEHGQPTIPWSELDIVLGSLHGAASAGVPLSVGFKTD